MLLRFFVRLSEDIFNVYADVNFVFLCLLLSLGACEKKLSDLFESYEMLGRQVGMIVIADVGIGWVRYKNEIL